MLDTELLFDPVAWPGSEVVTDPLPMDLSAPLANLRARSSRFEDGLRCAKPSSAAVGASNWISAFMFFNAKETAGTFLLISDQVGVAVP